MVQSFPSFTVLCAIAAAAMVLTPASTVVAFPPAYRAGGNTAGSGATPACADKYPEYAAFFGAMGCFTSLTFANMGASYGTAKSAIGMSFLTIKVMKLRYGADDRIMRGIVPVVMAGVLGIYGLIVAVIINNNINVDTHKYSAFAGYLHFGAGLAVGLSCLASGLAIGIVADASLRAYATQEKMFVAMILMQAFAGALGLFGLIMALSMNNTAIKIPGGCV